MFISQADHKVYIGLGKKIKRKAFVLANSQMHGFILPLPSSFSIAVLDKSAMLRLALLRHPSMSGGLTPWRGKV
jgi:hypothetical protein